MALTDLTDAQLTDIHEGIHTLNEAGRYDSALTKAHDLVTEALGEHPVAKAWPPGKDNDKDGDKDKGSSHSYADNGSGKCKSCGKGKADCPGKPMGKSVDGTLFVPVDDEGWMKRVAKAMVGFLKDEVDDDEDAYTPAEEHHPFH